MNSYIMRILIFSPHEPGSHFGSHFNVVVSKTEIYSHYILFHKFKLHLIAHPNILDMFSEFHRSNWWLPLKWSIEVKIENQA